MKLYHLFLALGAGAVAIAAPYVWPIIWAWIDRHILIILILSPYILIAIIFALLLTLLFAAFMFAKNS